MFRNHVSFLAGLGLKRKFSKFDKKFDSLVVIITVIFLIGSLLIPNNKLFFVWSTLYVLLIFWVTRSFEKTFIYLFFVLQIFNVGQLYIFNAIPPEKLNLSLYPRGRELYFKLTPSFILSLSILFGLFIQFFKYKTLKAMSVSMVLGLIGILFMTLSSIESRFFPVLSTLLVFSFLGSWAWIFFTKTFFLISKKENMYRILRTLLLILVFLLVFEGLIVIGQVLKGAPLGFLIEQLDNFTYFGIGADENPLFVRPAGLHDDSNNLAFYFISLYSGILILWFWLENKKELFLKYFFLLLTTGLTVLVIIFSQSRSAFLAFFIFFVSLFFLNKDLRNKIKGKFKQYENYLKLFFLFLAVFGAVILPDRSLHTLYSFTKSGGMEVRNKLEIEAVELIRKNPLFGVGLGMFIPASFDENQEGIAKEFPESVHNGFLLVLSEAGILASFCFILFFYFFIRKTYFSKNSFLIKSVFYFSIVANFVFMFFHPFFGILTINVILWLLLVES